MVAVVAVYMRRPEVSAPRSGTRYGPPGHPERARNVRPLDAQDHDPDAHEDEREEGADARQLGQDVDGQDAPGDGADDARDDRRDVGRAEARVNLRRDRRKEPVVGHREEDARLPEEHHEHHRRQARDGADLDRRGEPELARGLDADGDRVRAR